MGRRPDGASLSEVGASAPRADALERSHAETTPTPRGPGSSSCAGAIKTTLLGEEAAGLRSAQIKRKGRLGLGETVRSRARNLSCKESRGAQHPTSPTSAAAYPLPAPGGRAPASRRRRRRRRAAPWSPRPTATLCGAQPRLDEAAL